MGQSGNSQKGDIIWLRGKDGRNIAAISRRAKSGRRGAVMGRSKRNTATRGRRGDVMGRGRRGDVVGKGERNTAISRWATAGEAT